MKIRFLYRGKEILNDHALFVHYLDTNFHCDLACSSFNIIDDEFNSYIQNNIMSINLDKNTDTDKDADKDADKNKDKDNIYSIMLFTENLKNIKIENYGIVWRKDMLELIHETSKLELSDRDFILYCLENNFNVCYITE